MYTNLPLKVGMNTLVVCNIERSNLVRHACRTAKVNGSMPFAMLTDGPMGSAGFYSTRFQKSSLFRKNLLERTNAT